MGESDQTTTADEQANALYESRELLGLIVGSATEFAIFTTDPGRIILTWSPGAERLTGFAADEVVGGVADVLFTGEDRRGGAAEQEALAAVEAGRVEAERWYERKDGSRFWGHGVLMPRHGKSGVLRGFLKIVRDLTERPRTGQTLWAGERRLAKELDAMGQLHRLSISLLATSDLRRALQQILEAAISLYDADMGNVQLYNERRRALEIVAQKGFQWDFLDRFRTVTARDDCSCGRALRTGRRVVIQDVDTEPGYRPFREAVAAAGYRAVVSTPMRSRFGETLGVLSMHYREPLRSSEFELRACDLFARQAADFIERIRFEQALEESEERYRLLISEVKDYGIYMIDPQGSVMTWNAGAARLKGYSHEEIVGEHFSRFFNEADRRAGVPEMEMRRAEAEGRYETELWRVRKDGSRFWGNEVVTAVRSADGALRGFTKITRDITRQKRAREALEESERRFRAVADLVPDLLWSGDTNGLIEWYNRRWTEYTGRSRVESLGYGWLDVIHPDDRDRSRSGFLEAFATGRLFRQEHRILGVDGTYRWFLVQALPVRDGRGRILQWFGAATDVHEQRIALEAMRASEERIRQARDELDVKLRVRTAELSTALASLEGQDAARRELIDRLVTVQEEERRRISRELHDELGQQLAALMFRLELLKNSLDEESPGREQLGQVEEFANRIGREAHRIAFQLRPTALDDLGLLAALARFAEERSKDTGITFEVRSSGLEEKRLPSPVETTIYRVVQEATTNVLKHAEASRIIITVNRLKDCAFTMIEDDGQGFEVDGALGPRPPRTRLGLLGMRERVALVGGTLEIESTPGEGTSVLVRIPFDDTEESESHV